MDYNIQCTLAKIINDLEKRINNGNLNFNQKEEALSIIKQINEEYKNELEEYLVKQENLQNNDPSKFFYDYYFMKELVEKNTNVPQLQDNLTSLYKYWIVDKDLNWEVEFLEYTELLFQRIIREEQVLFLGFIFSMRNRYYDENNIDLIELNKKIKISRFNRKMISIIEKDPKMILGLSDVVRVDDDMIHILRDLVFTKGLHLEYIDKNFKEDLLINLIAIYNNKESLKYLHNKFKDNEVFYSLFI